MYINMLNTFFETLLIIFKFWHSVCVLNITRIRYHREIQEKPKKEIPSQSTVVSQFYIDCVYPPSPKNLPSGRFFYAALIYHNPLIHSNLNFAVPYKQYIRTRPYFLYHHTLHQQREKLFNLTIFKALTFDAVNIDPYLVIIFKWYIKAIWHGFFDIRSD